MLLIDKIDEALRSIKAPYQVCAFNLTPMEAPQLTLESSEVSSTAFGLPVFTPETREYLLSLRRRIVESGLPLKSEQELDLEIDEMRGR